VRQRFRFTLAAAGRWPDADGGRNLPKFNWVRIDNRGANPVVVGLNAQPGNDQIDFIASVSAGKVRVFNVGPPAERIQDSSDAWPDELHLFSVLGTTLEIDIADYPLVDLISTI
jgi:hypothetical protein